MLDVAVELLLGELSAVLLETQVGKDAEPQPVRIGHPVLCKRSASMLWGIGSPYVFSLIELPSQFSTFSLSFGVRLSQMTGASARVNPVTPLLDAAVEGGADFEGPTKRAVLNHALVIVSGIPPVFWMARVCARLKTLDPPVGPTVLSIAGEQKGQTPEGTREAFDLGGSLVETDGCGPGAIDAGLSGGEEGFQRVEDGREELLDGSPVLDVDLGEGMDIVVTQMNHDGGLLLGVPLCER